MSARALLGVYVAAVGVLCGTVAVVLGVSGGGSAGVCGPASDSGCLPEVASVAFAPWALLSGAALVASVVVLGGVLRGGGMRREARQGGATAGSRRARAAGLVIVLMSLVLVAGGAVGALEVSFETAWLGQQTPICTTDPCTFTEVLGHGRVWSRGGAGLLLGVAGLALVASAERRGAQSDVGVRRET